MECTHSSPNSQIIVHPVQRVVTTNHFTVVPDYKLLPDPSKHLPVSDLKVISRYFRRLGNGDSILRS